jgi:predicted RNA-binding protein associated with RNAse of E/G family
MDTEKIEITEDNDLIDPIGDLRSALNREMITRDNFHRFYNQLKNLPEFFEIAKKRCNQ